MYSEPESKIIYSKRFPRLSVEDFLKEHDDGELELLIQPEPPATLFKRIIEDNEYVFNPDKAAGRQKFIDLAKELSSDFEIDMKIEDCTYYITVTMYLDCATCAGSLKSMFAELITMSDRISSFIYADDTCDFVISLEYYTHDHYFAGRKVGY